MRLVMGSEMSQFPKQHRLGSEWLRGANGRLYDLRPPPIRRTDAAAGHDDSHSGTRASAAACHGTEPAVSGRRVFLADVGISGQNGVKLVILARCAGLDIDIASRCRVNGGVHFPVS